MVHVVHVHANDEVVPVHRHHRLLQFVDRLRPYRPRTDGCPAAISLKLSHQGHPGLKDPGTKGRTAVCLKPVGMFPEEIKVETEIEYPERRLRHIRPEQIRSKPRPPTDHLPELDTRIYGLEEDQIDNLRHVDTGIHHVHRDRDMRRIAGDREVVNQTLGILLPVVDHPGKLAGVVRILSLIHI